MFETDVSFKAMLNVCGMAYVSTELGFSLMLEAIGLSHLF